jgi:cytochrome c oxidase assembly protein subunit 15
VAPSRAFAITSRLALATSVLMFGLIVIGSVVRTTGSGLACPDWPLCQGRIIPPFQFNVLIEWFHRCVALLVSLLLFATVGSILAQRAVRARLGGLAALAVLLLFVQVLLGALTVWKLLAPQVVSAHLATALALFTTLLTTALVARAGVEDVPAAPAPAVAPERVENGSLTPLFATAAGLTFVQALLGGIVSTNGAGLACPDWPTCNGVLFPPMRGEVALQMLHRFGAYALLAVMLAVLVRTRRVADPALRSGGGLLFGLTLVQALFGILNVRLAMPVWLSALHLGTATAILALGVTLTFLSATPAFAGGRTGRTGSRVARVTA